MAKPLHNERKFCSQTCQPEYRSARWLKPREEFDIIHIPTANIWQVTIVGVLTYKHQWCKDSSQTPVTNLNDSTRVKLKITRLESFLKITRLGVESRNLAFNLCIEKNFGKLILAARWRKIVA